jgi:hypothetical protein
VTSRRHLPHCHCRSSCGTEFNLQLGHLFFALAAAAFAATGFFGRLLLFLIVLLLGPTGTADAESVSVAERDLALVVLLLFLLRLLLLTPLLLSWLLAAQLTSLSFRTHVNTFFIH